MEAELSTGSGYNIPASTASGSNYSRSSSVSEAPRPDATAATFSSERASAHSTGEDERFAKVVLSFEPQLTTDSESITELFQVLFNTVLHRYSHMHAHGILGDVALAWLTESVGEAMDTASQEVNSATATDFKRLSRPSRVSDRESTKAFVVQRINSRISSKASSQQSRWSSWSWRLSSITPGSVGRESQGSKPDSKPNMFVRTMATFESRQKPRWHGLFEPIIIEYLSLEARVLKASPWDHLPRGWTRLRQLGFGSTRAKVEALWAFVVAHEKVMKESPTLERFPVLVTCIQCVVDEIKDDLAILEEIEPRRFFFSRHLLAIRVLMNSRLARLKKITDEGWLTPGDVERLVEELQERIVQADNFFPRFFDGGQTPLALTSAWSSLFGVGHLNSDSSGVSRLPSIRSSITGADFFLVRRSMVQSQLSTSTS